MFALRGIAVSLSFFWFTYCLLSALAVSSWQFLHRVRTIPPRVSATFLFAARMLPLTVSIAVTLAVTVPSFIWLEPRGTDEGIGVAPLVFSAFCITLFAICCMRAIYAQTNTKQVISQWLRGARTLSLSGLVPTFQLGGAVPPLTLAGVRRHRLFVSEAALSVLSPDELTVAVKHEVAHMRVHDNFKKLILRLAWFPGMGELDNAWQWAAELRADDEAVSSAREALDLAAALIKLSRQPRNQLLPTVSLGLVHDAFVRVRVFRLLNWKATELRSAWKLPCLLLCGAVLLLITAVAYGPLLQETHAMAEWLVR
jgi:Zn-dependent protease with chaperone function